MAEVTQEQIQEAIKGYMEPHMAKDLVSAKVVKGIDIRGGEVKVKIELGFPANGFKDELPGLQDVAIAERTVRLERHVLVRALGRRYSQDLCPG